MTQSLYSSQIWQQMIAGRPYQTQAKPLKRARQQAKDYCDRLNGSSVASERRRWCELLLPNATVASIGNGFYCDYGVNISSQANLQIGNNVVMLDAGLILLGQNVVLGEGVVIAAMHHMHNEIRRRAGWQYTQPVNIGNNVIIESGATILPGAHISDNVTIKANQVVTARYPA